MRALLVYDGRSPIFRRAIAAFTRGTDLRPVRWESAAVQRFLRAQFDAAEPPFAFLLVEEDVVHAGSETVERALARRVDGDLPGLLADAYPATAEPFGRLVHGRAPADIDGTFALTPAAREAVAPLRRDGTIPVTGGGRD
jgi:hypothetical protein